MDQEEIDTYLSERKLLLSGNNLVDMADLIERVNLYLYKWKGLAQYFGVSVRTLQGWNQLLRIPWEKSGAARSNRVRIHTQIANKYLSLLRKLQEEILKVVV